MDENSVQVPLHQRSLTQWVYISAGIVGGVVALFVWLGIGPKDLARFASRIWAFCLAQKYVGGIALVAVLTYRIRRLIFAALMRAIEFMRTLYVRVLTFFLKPVLESHVSDPTIRFGDLVVFQHYTTGRYLTSLDLCYYTHPKGSGQQISFGAAVPDQNSIWRIEGPHGTKYEDRKGQVLRENNVIRIYHVASDQYLHSHIDESPASTEKNVQREVSVSSQNNLQDNWTTSAPSDFGFGQLLRFEHSDGGQFLHSHAREFDVKGRVACCEVTTCGARNDDDFWILRRIEFVGVKAPNPVATKKLAIYWASFGSGKKYHNVTKILRDEVRDGSLSISASFDKVGAHIVGDPSPGTPKMLSVHYSTDGVRKHKAVPEGQVLNL